MKTRYDLFIGGEWVQPRSGKYLSDYSPWNGEFLTEVAAANEEDINAAVLSAEKAQKHWSRVSPMERERVLAKVAELIMQQFEELASIIVDESGSTLGKARIEVVGTAEYFRTAAGECRRIYGDVLSSGQNSNLSMVTLAPRGVVAAIGPYNFPFLLLACKVAFAVAAGNGVVIKSSSDTPVVAYLIAELLQKAGAPAGLVNAISGSGSLIGDILVTHPKVDMVTFTGSTEVGRRINIKASETFKKVCLEMGGKSPMVVLKDADVDFAAASAASGIFWHQGQVCMANSRIIVESPIFDRFVEKLKLAAESQTIGTATERDVDIGPIITQKQISLIDEHVCDAMQKGAALITGGVSSGQFYPPTVLTGVTRSMKVYNEETFGPVVSVYKFDSIEEAIELANDTPYGLSGSVITNDLNLGIKLAREIDTGMIHINDSAIYGDSYAPFGGVKESGNGREGGHYSIEEFTLKKWITVKA